MVIRDGDFAGNSAECDPTLERDMEEYLVNNLEKLQPGLRFDARQVTTGVGVVDILAREGDGGFVIIELKVGQATEVAVAQISRYIGWFAKEKTPRIVRGILVANRFSSEAQYAASVIPRLTLKKAKVQFEFESV